MTEKVLPSPSANLYERSMNALISNFENEESKPAMDYIVGSFLDSLQEIPNKQHRKHSNELIKNLSLEQIQIPPVVEYFKGEINDKNTDFSRNDFKLGHDHESRDGIYPIMNDHRQRQYNFIKDISIPQDMQINGHHAIQRQSSNDTNSLDLHSRHSSIDMNIHSARHSPIDIQTQHVARHSPIDLQSQQMARQNSIDMQNQQMQHNINQHIARQNSIDLQNQMRQNQMSMNPIQAQNQLSMTPLHQNQINMHPHNTLEIHPISSQQQLDFNHMRTNSGEMLPMRHDTFDMHMMGYRQLPLTITQEFKCTFKNCAKQFRKDSSFQAHIKTHLEKKQFQCDKCPQAFSRSHGFVN